MSRIRLVVAFALVVLGVPAVLAAQAKDFKNYKDPELLSRMPNYYLSHGDSFKEAQFDVRTFTVQADKKLDRVQVEGRVREWNYIFDRTSGAALASPLQIQRNYQNAVKGLGGKILWEEQNYSRRTTLQLVRDGKEIWVQVAPVGDGHRYVLTMVEREAMKQDVVADAAALKSGLGATGHVEVPGILFDTNQSVLKPESEAAVAEVAKMLKADPALKVWVVGHTDSTGVAASNLTLSGARAAAVVQALVQKHGIDARRLGSFGAGPYAPVASNTDEAGRAKNRRVELVAQ